ncbi:hypothetical protein C6Y62_08985 [Hyphomicrobium sulfonivorans]|nr:hypothetical protein [Hyphomicrobium sulfonivorans]
MLPKRLKNRAPGESLDVDIPLQEHRIIPPIHNPFFESHIRTNSCADCDSKAVDDLQVSFLRQESAIIDSSARSV